MIVWPLVVYFVVVILLVAGMLAVSFVLGERHREPATGAPYESGILSQGSAQVRLSAKSYMVAMFFVIFDLEAVFICGRSRAGNWAGLVTVNCWSSSECYPLRSHISGE